RPLFPEGESREGRAADSAGRNGPPPGPPRDRMPGGGGGCGAVSGGVMGAKPEKIPADASRAWTAGTRRPFLWPEIRGGIPFRWQGDPAENGGRWRGQPPFPTRRL